MPPSSSASNTWILLALMTVLFWGLYGVFIHTGVTSFEPKGDPSNRYRAFLFVGLAYFLTAVLAPLVMLLAKGSSWDFLTQPRGVGWSLLAGCVGAAGAFCVLLAFALAPSPRLIPVIMSIIFAGAPIINAIAAFIAHPPRDEAGQITFATIHPMFYVGILLAAGGGLLVTLFKPT